MHHDLKIDLPYYMAVIRGEKTFEIRNNDRGYQKGDTVTLTPHTSQGMIKSRLPPINATITYVSGFNQKENWVVFGIKLEGGGE